MAKESFADPSTSSYLNDNFIPVWVNKNEHPDVADYYLKSIRATGDAGGWPLLAFANPKGRPYFLGTYFASIEKYGKPPFLKVCQTMHMAFVKKRESVEKSCSMIAADVESIYRSFDTGVDSSLSVTLGDAIVAGSKTMLKAWDRANGGFGNKPKFPMLYALCFLRKQVPILLEKKRKQFFFSIVKS